MDLKPLNYVVRVAELGIFTRASIAIGMSHACIAMTTGTLDTGRGLFAADTGSTLSATQHRDTKIAADIVQSVVMQALKAYH